MGVIICLSEAFVFPKTVMPCFDPGRYGKRVFEGIVAYEATYPPFGAY